MVQTMLDPFQIRVVRDRLCKGETIPGHVISGGRLIAITAEQSPDDDNKFVAVTEDGQVGRPVGLYNLLLSGEVLEEIEVCAAQFRQADAEARQAQEEARKQADLNRMMANMRARHGRNAYGQYGGWRRGQIG